MALSITELKKGTLFQLNTEPYRVIEYNQKVMGRGGSIVNVRIKSLLDGKVLEKTFKGNEQLDYADVVNKKAQYLYDDGSKFYFMDKLTFDQFEVAADVISDQSGYLMEGDEVAAQIFDNRVISIELPKNLTMEVTYTESVVKGDTTNSITKYATLATGMVIKVPAFIKQGDKIKVDTRTGQYLERIK